MGTLHWQGRADAVAQVTTVQVTAFDAATTYTLTINGEDIDTPGDTDANTTAANMATNWNAATSAYFTGITATSATDTVTLTADVAGVPFTVTKSETGGTGTLGAVTEATAPTGPHHWDNALNWDTGAVPVNNDIVHIKDTGQSILYGLDQNTVTLYGLHIYQSFTGLIGLRYDALSTSLDGTTVDTDKPEYRETYLKIGVDAAQGEARYGIPAGTSTATGSARICHDLGTTAATVRVFNTANSSQESGRPALRLLANNAGTDVFVLSCPAGLGIAAEVPGETATVQTIQVGRNTGGGSFVVTGTGFSTSGSDLISVSSGLAVIDMASGTPNFYIDGGELRTLGDWTTPSINIFGGLVRWNARNSGGNEATAIIMEAGELDLSGNRESFAAASWTVNGGVIRTNGDVTVNLTTDTARPAVITVSS